MTVQSDDSERTPLLNANDSESGKTISTPIPWLQVSLLIYARSLDLWYYFCVLPYIGEMLMSVGVEEADIGFYAGLVEGSFSLAECIFLLFFWTSLSEKIGRRPVMLICLFGISTSAVLYGLAGNVWWMIASRAMAGCFSGCSGMSRVMLGEISDTSNRARVYSVSSSIIAISAMIGPVVGSALARPVDRYKFFAGWTLFMRFPYLLPSLATGLFGYLAFIGNACFLKETYRPENGPSEEATSMGTLELLTYPKVRTVLLLTTAFMTPEFSWTAMIPVFAFTSVRLGGLGWDITSIAYIFTVLAAAHMLVYLVAFPPFLRIFGVRGGLIFAGCTLAGVFTTAPLSNLALRAGRDAMAYTCLSATVTLEVFTNMFWITYALAINDASPSPRGFARINTVSQVCATAVRTIGPPIFTSIYAIGVKNQILQGQLAWTCLAICASLWVACMRFYPRDLEKQKETVEVLSPSREEE